MSRKSTFAGEAGYIALCDNHDGSIPSPIEPRGGSKSLRESLSPYRLCLWVVQLCGPRLHEVHRAGVSTTVRDNSVVFPISHHGDKAFQKRKKRFSSHSHGCEV